MKIETLASGACRVGVHRTTLTPEAGYAMAGYSWAGRIGAPSVGEDLFARALYLESEGECVALCFIDLMSASLRLVSAVAERLRNAGESKLAENFILSGTHTHTGPGNFYGNAFYDVFAQNLFSAKRRGFQPGLVAQLADAITLALVEAKRTARRGRLSVTRTEAWGVSRNRSFEAYCANFAHGSGERVTLRGTPPAELHETQCAIDPRLTTLTALRSIPAAAEDTGGAAGAAGTAGAEGTASAAGAGRAARSEEVIGVFSMFGCHATALGPKWESYARDWPGFFVDAVEAGLRERGLSQNGNALAALGQGAAGDITPLPVEDDRGLAQGQDLARRVGSALANAALSCVEHALLAASDAPLVLSHEAGRFRVAAEDGARSWMIGLPVLGGAEDGRSVFHELGFVREGTLQQPDGSAQSPKLPALGLIQELLTDVALDIAPHHPWHRLTLGEHVIFSVPGEPTAVAAAELEAAILARTGRTSANVLGYTGDYAGYFTTEAEYECQHYEGAHTLYGRSSLALYRDALLGPASGIPELPETSDAEQASVSSAAARSLDRLSREAWRIPASSACVRILFGGEATATFSSASLAIPTNGTSYARCRGSVRRLPGAGDETTALFQADFSREKLGANLPELGVLLELEGRRLPVRAQVPLGNATARAALGPPRVLVPFALGALLSWVVAAALLALPEIVIHALAVPSTAASLLLARMHALGFVLFGVNLWFSRRTRDARAMLGIGVGLCWFFAVAAALTFQASGQRWLLGLLVPSAVFGVLSWKAARFSRQQPRVSPEAWRFTPPLEWVGALTLFGGFVLMWAPQWLLKLLSVDEPPTALLLCLYGANFLVNTCFMWGARHSRDVSVVRGQLLGSVLMDGITSLMLVFAVGAGTINWLGAALALPYAFIVWRFGPLLTELRRWENRIVARPSSEEELRELVKNARRSGRALRVMGSGHSVARVIHSDAFPEQHSERLSDRRAIDVLLDGYARVVFEDLATGRITVQAGMHLGPSPNDPGSLENNLASYLRARGLALPDLGGITHQSVGGFVSTGSAGGSLRYAFGDAVLAIRFVNGRGEVHTAYRDRDPELFQAVAVSMGLFGIISEVTLQCVPEYAVEGSETTVALDGARFQLDGKTYHVDAEHDGLLDILKANDYSRILWWPQPGVKRLAIWRGRRTPATLKPKPLPPVSFQEVAGRMLQFFGNVYGTGLSNRLARALRPKLLPAAIKLFQPLKVRRFHDSWDKALPMDNGVDDYWLPTEFTELWVPLERTPELMRRLLEHYEKKGWDAAGNFSCEIYAAKHLPFWLSPAYGRDVVRVDIFWFGRNCGDPSPYFSQFWELLAPFDFRAHWAKHMPQAGSRYGQAYIAQQYPKLARFLELRAQHDPEQLFVNGYLRSQLGIR